MHHLYQLHKLLNRVTRESVGVIIKTTELLAAQSYRMYISERSSIEICDNNTQILIE